MVNNWQSSNLVKINHLFTLCPQQRSWALKRERQRQRDTEREKREGEESTHTTLLTELLQTYDHKSHKNTLAKPSISIFLNVESHLPTRWYDYFKLSFFPCNLCHCPLHDDLSSDTAGEKQGPHSASSSKPLHLWQYTLPSSLLNWRQCSCFYLGSSLLSVSSLFSFPITFSRTLRENRIENDFSFLVSVWIDVLFF